MRRALRLRVTMRRPRLEDQIRISRLYLSMDVSPGEMESFSVRERMEFMARHGVTLSRSIGDCKPSPSAPGMAWVVTLYPVNSCT